jgi:hypothetical protein
MKENDTDSIYVNQTDFAKIRAAELGFINKHHGHPDGVARPLTGLALSGGGIRSAIFNLGVMQALAKRGLMHHLDYLSTVSGGGYTGSSLTWFLNTNIGNDFSERANDPALPFGTKEHNFPYGTDEPGHIITGKNSHLQRDLMDHLRRRGNYLTPGEGFTVLTLMAVVLRNALISLMIWIPLIAGVMYLPMLLGSDGADSIPFFYQGIGYGGAFAVLLFAVSSAVLALLVTFVTTVKANDDVSLSLRRLTDQWGTRLLNIGFALIGLFVIAWIGSAEILKAMTTLSMSASSVLIGIVTSLTAMFKPDSRLVNKVFLPLASGLLAFGLLLCAYKLAYSAAFIAPPEYLEVLGLTWGHVLLMTFVSALVLGLVADVNYITIARYYRDRLKETFMPDANTLKPDGTQSQPREVWLKDLCQLNENEKNPDQQPDPGPYHLINTNVVLIDSDDKKYNRRGGDSFILSPLYCGSKATGWLSTSESLYRHLTLGTAMATSGAAVNPNTGPGGRGVTRNRVVSFVLAVLNLRLGIWLPNPDPHAKSSFLPPGNFLLSAWYGINSWLGGCGYHENAAYLQISDGGHFENLGLYELLRRELDLIIVSDATADYTFTFSDLRRALRFAETDLDVEISFDSDERLSHLVPNDGIDMGSPMAEARKGYLHATIAYKNGKEGSLYYLKSTMIGGQRVRTKSYKLEYPRFPDQPTSDQFFDEAQFAAYRDLGYTIALDMLENCDLKPLDHRILRDRRSSIERRREIIPFPSEEERREDQRRTRDRRVS